MRNESPQKGAVPAAAPRPGRALGAAPLQPPTCRGAGAARSPPHRPRGAATTRLASARPGPAALPATRRCLSLHSPHRSGPRRPRRTPTAFGAPFVSPPPPPPPFAPSQSRREMTYRASGRVRGPGGGGRTGREGKGTGNRGRRRGMAAAAGGGNEGGSEGEGEGTAALPTAVSHFSRDGLSPSRWPRAPCASSSLQSPSGAAAASQRSPYPPTPSGRPPVALRALPHPGEHRTPRPPYSSASFPGRPRSSPHRGGWGERGGGRARGSGRNWR